MRTDQMAAIQGALGLIDDELAELQSWWPQLCGRLDSHERWEKKMSVRIRDEFSEIHKWPKGTTETQKKRDVEMALIERYPDRFRDLEELVEMKVKGDKLYQLLDARRSIGQTLMKPHVAELEPGGRQRFGQQEHGQAGMGA